MEILKGKDAKAYLDSATWKGSRLTEESVALQGLMPGDVMLVDHDLTDCSGAAGCKKSRSLRQTAVNWWGAGSVSVRHASTIAIHRKK